SIQGRYHSLYWMNLYADLGIRPGRNLFEAAYVIDGKLTPNDDLMTERGGRVRVREWPAVEMMACTVHCGADNQRHLAHQAMLRWITQEGYVLAGPMRETYLWRSLPDETSDEHVTEIQHPIRKIDASA